MNNRHMKRHSIPSATREMEMETTVRHPLTHTRMAITKKTTITRVREDVEKCKPPYTGEGKCKMVQQLWKTVWQLVEGLNTEAPHAPAIPFTGIYPRELKCMFTQKLIQMCTVALVIIAKNVMARRLHRKKKNVLFC